MQSQRFLAEISSSSPRLMTTLGATCSQEKLDNLQPEPMAKSAVEFTGSRTVQSSEFVVVFPDGDMHVPRDFGGEDDAVEWLQYVDYFCSRFPNPGPERANVLQQLLIGVAQLWYQEFMQVNEQFSWSNFCESFVCRFGGKVLQEQGSTDYLTEMHPSFSVQLECSSEELTSEYRASTVPSMPELALISKGAERSVTGSSETKEASKFELELSPNLVSKENRGDPFPLSKFDEGYSMDVDSMAELVKEAFEPLEKNSVKFDELVLVDSLPIYLLTFAFECDNSFEISENLEVFGFHVVTDSILSTGIRLKTWVIDPGILRILLNIERAWNVQRNEDELILLSANGAFLKYLEIASALLKIADDDGITINNALVYSDVDDKTNISLDILLKDSVYLNTSRVQKSFHINFITSTTELDIDPIAASCFYNYCGGVNNCSACGNRLKSFVVDPGIMWNIDVISSPLDSGILVVELLDYSRDHNVVKFKECWYLTDFVYRERRPNHFIFDLGDFGNINSDNREMILRVGGTDFGLSILSQFRFKVFYHWDHHKKIYDWSSIPLCVESLLNNICFPASVFSIFKVKTNHWGIHSMLRTLMKNMY